jgi:hypothetical protein
MERDKNEQFVSEEQLKKETLEAMQETAINSRNVDRAQGAIWKRKIKV